MYSLPIINKTYEAYKDIIDINNHTKKRTRYSLGSSLENSILECLENLIMAKNAPKTLKAGYLIRAGSKLEVSNLKLRLLLEFAIANETKIFQTQSKLAEIGRMLGGWLKATQSLFDEKQAVVARLKPGGYSPRVVILKFFELKIKQKMPRHCVGAKEK